MRSTHTNRNYGSLFTRPPRKTCWKTNDMHENLWSPPNMGLQFPGTLSYLCLFRKSRQRFVPCRCSTVPPIAPSNGTLPYRFPARCELNFANGQSAVWSGRLFSFRKRVDPLQLPERVLLHQCSIPHRCCSLPNCPNWFLISLTSSMCFNGIENYDCSVKTFVLWT